MFDFDAGKLVIIGIVALIVIGPKELPRVMRQVGQVIAKMRRMAAEFQNQFMEAMHEADLADAKAELAKLKESAAVDLSGFNPVQDLKREVSAAVEGTRAQTAAQAGPLMTALPQTDAPHADVPQGDAPQGDAPRDEEEPLGTPVAQAEQGKPGSSH